MKTYELDYYKLLEYHAMDAQTRQTSTQYGIKWLEDGAMTMGFSTEQAARGFADAVCQRAEIAKAKKGKAGL